MRPRFGLLTLVGALTLAAWVVRGAVGVSAVEEPAPARSQRGGWEVATPRYRFEIFFYRTGLRIFPRTGAGAPIATSNLTGSAAFSLPGAPQPLVYPLNGKAPARGRESESLDLSAELSWVPADETVVRLTIEGLPDPAEPRVTLTVPFELVRRAAAAAPAPGNAAPAGAAPPPSAPSYSYQSGYYGPAYYPAASAPAPAPAAAFVPYTAPEREVPLERPWASPHQESDYDFYRQGLYGG